MLGVGLFLIPISDLFFLFYPPSSFQVVLLAHSMGNKVVHYFLNWAEKKYSASWSHTHIHAFLAMGAPFLGSSKAVRAALCGDAMGLELFLTKEEALYMARVSASLPWLFPLREELYPDIVVRMSTSSLSTTNSNPLSLSSPRHNSSSTHVNVPFTTPIGSSSPHSLRFYQQFYRENPLYLKQEEVGTKEQGWGGGGEGKPPCVKRIWPLYGVNRTTEVGYFLKKGGGKEGGGSGGEGGLVVLDGAADRYSGKKLAMVNPRGLMIVEGISYETKDTFQTSIKVFIFL